MSSAADALLASRLAAQAFSSGDVGQYDALMAAGTRANLADNPAAAEQAFRAALAIQQKALGKDNPNTATPLMSLALQLSNEGRFAEAEGLFADAQRLVAKSVDPTAQARLYHYRGLDAMNQGKLDQSLKLLTQADALYAAGVPESALKAKAAPTGVDRFMRASFRVGDLMPSQELLTDPRAQTALLGLIEVRRNRAVLLRVLGQPKQADAMLQSATDLAQGNGLARPLLNARLYRTSAITAAAQGEDSQALSDLQESAAAFDRSLPGSKPLADTYLLHARELVRTGKIADALPLCRSAVQTLSSLKAGTTPVLMASCLDVYAHEADAQKDKRQELLGEMFTAAQLAQGSITSQQIAQASATLAENSRDPKVGDAIRKQRDLKGKLDNLYQPARRPGSNRSGRAWRSPGSDGAGRGAGQADQGHAGATGRCRRCVAGGVAELRPARAAGRHRGRCVQGAASARSVRRDQPVRSRRLGVPAARRNHRRVESVGGDHRRSPGWCAGFARASS